MKQVMVDIETFDTSSNAVVLSAAAVEFSLGPATYQRKNCCVWYPSLREQFALGRTVSAGTQEWWLREELATARADWAFLDGVKCEESIQSFYESLAQVVEGADEVWADGVVFDIGILESLFSQIDKRPPWKNYNVIRDLRTVKKVMPVKRFIDFPPPAGNPHDPLYDCEHQIQHLWSMWPNEHENAISTTQGVFAGVPESVLSAPIDKAPERYRGPRNFRPSY